MKPVVKKYVNDEELEIEINTLKDQSISPKDIYILSHDSDRTSRIVRNTEVTGINYNSYETQENYEKQGDELRYKLKSLGITQEESEKYEEEMDQGKVLLIVTDERVKGEL
ncbi:general stress protein [Staphylococcus succinus]|uniref:General stress protein n=1 Tax=Staphylococcus succinus TaxID=61015 RepID=A0A9Q6HQJ3_9STAP|nr:MULTISPECIES: general stress protein [Staphylococcus]MBU0438850.1 general stress protein [Staphylococcus succinus]MDH9161126.1 general stress protein [Staphylococcus succinus]MEB7463071.1 general stress protein [Staphylococcus succinus]MEB8123936.1 general stress protein [Staphylococcus succinus]MEB8127696.1 general stress protein [Staphylococcus succinus]